MTPAAPQSHLAESLEQLSDIAAEAGLDPAAARDEGLRVAAALAEAVPDAARGWAEVADPDLRDLATVNEAFFDAASSGRRWRSSPTDLLDSLVSSGSSLAGEYAEALTEVASAAVMLGTAPIWVIANASAASAAYLSAAEVGGTPHAPIGHLPGTTPGHPGEEGPVTTAPGLPPLPAGPGTDAVLRSWGLVREPSTTDGVHGGALGGIPDGAGSAAAQANPAESTAATEEPAEPEKSVDELLAELDAMIGLERVKKEIHRQVALLTVERMRTEAGLKAPRMSRHLIFVGNPGTGKTTVARLIGAIYRALKLLPQGQLVEVDRSELVAGYVGQTAMKTAEVCAKAVGGVLFIDEAYALAGDQFAQEAVNTLVKEMEDHRQDLVVIVAGYPDPMVGFIAQNPGLASRFTTTIEFDDYSDDELMAILTSIAGESDYELTDDAEKRVGMILEATPRTPAFGNGRFSRNLFEHAVGRHAWRLKDATEPTRDDLRLLTEGDFIEAPDDEPPAYPTISTATDHTTTDHTTTPEPGGAHTGSDGDPLRADPDTAPALGEAEFDETAPDGTAPDEGELETESPGGRAVARTSDETTEEPA